MWNPKVQKRCHKRQPLELTIPQKWNTLQKNVSTSTSPSSVCFVKRVLPPRGVLFRTNSKIPSRRIFYRRVTRFLLQLFYRVSCNPISRHKGLQFVFIRKCRACYYLRANKNTQKQCLAWNCSERARGVTQSSKTCAWLWFAARGSAWWKDVGWTRPCDNWSCSLWFS
jgi:hypothetical protein